MTHRPGAAAPKVLIVSDYAYPSGGIEHMVRELLAGLAPAHDCALLTWRPDAVVPEGFADVVTVDYGDLRDAWPMMEAADVLLVQTSFNTRLLAMLAGEYLERRPKPAVTVVHTSSHSRPDAPYRLVQEAWLTRLLDASARTVAVSADVEKALRALPDADQRDWRVTVIENAARLAAVPTRPKGRRAVSFVGRPSPQKGWDLFLRLSRELADTGLSFAANTVHAAPDEVDVLAGGRLRLCHRLTEAEMVEFFDETDLLVAPYRYGDGLPMAVLEAMNCGVPVLGFDTEGLGRLLRRHGQLVVPPEYGALAAAVRGWAAGRVPLTAPEPLTVRGWDEAAEEYAAVLGEVLASAAHLPHSQP